MRQCKVKPAWIGYALKHRPYWEGQTRLIPSLFCMLSFLALLKRKTVKRTLLQTDNIFSSQIKKHPYADTKISGISEKKRIKLDISVDFLKKKHFCTIQNNIVFNFNLQFWRCATLLTRTLYLSTFYCKLLSKTNQQLFLRHWKRYRPSNHIALLYELLVSILWLTLSFGEVSKTCRRMH